MLDSNFIAKEIALDIPRAFVKVEHKPLLCRNSNYNITGRDFVIIMSLLSGKPMKAIVNRQSSEAQGLNAFAPRTFLRFEPSFCFTLTTRPSTFIDCYEKSMHMMTHYMRVLRYDLLYVN